MPPEWTGHAIGRMHNHDITYQDVASEMGIGKPYLSQILNGTRTPPNAQERVERAVQAIIERREKEVMHHAENDSDYRSGGRACGSSD